MIIPLGVSLPNEIAIAIGGANCHSNLSFFHLVNLDVSLTNSVDFLSGSKRIHRDPLKKKKGGERKGKEKLIV